MKKALTVICFLLVMAMLFAPFCSAEGADSDTLVDWNIRIPVPEGTTAVLKGNYYYIYAQKAGSIPYVMVSAYHYESMDKLIQDLDALMREQYKDLEVTTELHERTIGEKDCLEIGYGYTISGNVVRDRRIFTSCDDLFYMFASKEVEARGMVIGTMLEDVVAGCRFLSEEENELTELEDDWVLAEGYLYCQNDGMPKYWLDFTGMVADNLVLHCYFRSGEPTFYESDYILDLSTADIEDAVITIHDVYDLNGFDVSDWFKRVSIRLDEDTVTMVIRRDNNTLAGGGDDNILTGVYEMDPIGIGGYFEYHDENGMRKYWLDLNGEDPELHAMFRSGEPEFYEEVFILDPDSIEQESEYSIRINRIWNSAGKDVSKWFRSFTLSQVQGAVLMTVERDEKTLAGGADDNILTGVYLLVPHAYLRPAELGPYTGEELARWARIYYFRDTGFFPPEADVEENSDGTFTIHLYEVVEQDGTVHTATSAWYTVDEYGTGQNDITGKEIDLCW